MAGRSWLGTLALVVGSALGGVCLFIVSIVGYVYYKAYTGAPFPMFSFSTHPPRARERTVDVPPPVGQVARFAGSHAVMMGDFPMDKRHTVLAGGPGRISGTVRANGRPVQGLRLRLALNGAVMSQWATSGADGRYEVAVPYARYRVDGYELDSSSAHEVLAGKVDGPRNVRHTVSTHDVADGRPGQGLDLVYVDPVIKTGPVGVIAAGAPAIASWQPYPLASAYRLQLIEQRDPDDYNGQQRLFGWRERPVVAGTSTNLADHGVKLKKGHYYTLEVEALSEQQRPLAESARNLGNADFRVAE